VRGRAYGITNFVSRPITGLSPIVTEYTDKPLGFIFVFSFTSLFTLRLIKTLVSEDKGSQNLSDSDEQLTKVEVKEHGSQEKKSEKPKDLEL